MAKAKTKPSNGIANRVRELRMVRAGDLSPNPRNWRTHPKTQQDALLGVLSEIGYADALLARELPDGTLELVDGHLRRETTPEQVVPVLVLDLNQDEALKLMTLLDPLGAMAEANEEALASLLEEITTDSDGLQAMLDGLAAENGIAVGDEPPAVPDAEVDRAAELQKEWGTATGQVWLIEGAKGTHRIMCGDSTNKDDVAVLLGGACPALMVTDPPYGVEYDPNWRNEAEAASGKTTRSHRRIGTVTNDERIDWSDAWRLFPGNVAYTWSPSGDNVIQTGLALQSAGYQIRNQIMWRKPHFPISRGHYTYQHEPCWYAVKKGRKSHWIGDASASTVWEIPLDKNVEGGHSTQKPLECMARPIRNHEGDVYEPFLGSGTTLMAAEQLGRVCYGMEISPGYVAVCLERAKASGLVPKLSE